MFRREFLKALLALPLVSLTGLRKAFAGRAPRQLRPLTRLAFGSCLDQEMPQPIWDTILAQNPDLFVFLGDNIYADTEDLKLMQARYDQQGAVPQYKNFRSKVPIIATWDDHDYGINDGGAEYPQKQASKEIMLKFFNEPANSSRWKRDGVYVSYTFGEAPQRTQVILLDLRWHRTEIKRAPDGAYIPDPDPRATMLGEDQWRWLEAKLQEPADLRILGSSIQLVAPDHAWEKWANYPVDKARFMNLVDRLALQNLVVISGDMHYAELSVEKTPGGLPVYDLTSSSLTHTEAAPEIPNRNAVARFETGNNFGLVRVDWSRPRHPVVHLEIIDDRGTVRIGHALNL